VQIQTITPEIAETLGLKDAQGALVSEPQPNSPAAKAGIRSRDVITSLNGEPVKDARALARTVAGMRPGTKIELGVVRDSKPQKVTVTLGELPAETVGRGEPGQRPSSPRGERGDGSLGLTLAPARAIPGMSNGGVVVTDVAPDGPAAARGFKPGDVILEVAGKSVSTPDEVKSAVDEATRAGKNAILMRVRSGEASRFVAVPLGSG
jgi:serine protease Do